MHFYHVPVCIIGLKFDPPSTAVFFLPRRTLAEGSDGRIQNLCLYFGLPKSNVEEKEEGEEKEEDEEEKNNKKKEESVAEE